MPTYEYQCTDCGKPYDVFHKSKELIEDIVCPSCGSANAKRLMSIPSIGSSIKSNTTNAAPACEYANTPSCSGNCDMFK
ncbi:MAG: zinc ribbon domain-containing protein [Bacteroidota bacterium]|nr:zinc ribbon domain-containing protein [Bacteroidota bacterium]